MLGSCSFRHRGWVRAPPPGRPAPRILRSQSRNCRYSAARTRAHKEAPKSGFAVSQIEGLRDGLTYTIDTVEQLVAENSSDEFLLVIGQDSLETMPRWQRIKELLELCPLAVYRRGGQNTTEAERAIAALGGRVSWMDGPLVDVSATKLREDIALGGAPEDRMPPGVYEYIQLHRLYGAMDSK